jgi:3-mercaptopyruvate sulfurtransferase SseA
VKNLTSPSRGLLVSSLLVLAILGCSSLVPTQAPYPTEDPHLDIPRVSLAEAKVAFDTGAAIFIDVRGVESYKVSHIPGAISLPSEQMINRLDEFDKAQWIITYCT